MERRRPRRRCWITSICVFTAPLWWFTAHVASAEEPQSPAPEQPTVETSTDDPFEGMVLIPAGEFMMGSADDDIQAEGDELPQRVIALPDFYIDQFEVTNVEYKRFLDATGYPAPPQWQEGRYREDDDFDPVVNVTWWDATAYARWAGKRLPTEEEWEKAARGPNGRRFPWGDEYDSHLANSGRSLVPANAYIEGASPYGVVNMAGNAAEWTATPYEPYPDLAAVLPAEFGGTESSKQVSRPRVQKREPPPIEKLEPRATPEDPEDAAYAQADSIQHANDPRLAFFHAGELQDEPPRVHRGGGIGAFTNYLRCANRERESPGRRWANLGFRCAKDAPSTPKGR